MRIFILFLLIILAYPASGQNINVASPSSGKANSSVADKSVFSYFSNQAGISDITNYVIGVSYTEKFHSESFSTKSIFTIIPSKWFVVAADYERFGLTDYFEEQFGISIGKNLTKELSLGVRFKYSHSYIKKYKNNYTSYNVDIGLQYKLPLNITFGIHFTNPFTYRNYLNEQLLSVGVNWTINSLLFSYEYDKILNGYDFNLVGVKWNILNDIDINCGYSTIGDTRYIGVGDLYKKYYLSVNFSVHETLGLSSAISISYEF